jgi:hypothetical protein
MKTQKSREAGKHGKAEKWRSTEAKKQRKAEKKRSWKPEI